MNIRYEKTILTKNVSGVPNRTDNISVFLLLEQKKNVLQYFLIKYYDKSFIKENIFKENERKLRLI